ncbi:hypothetical protein, partial [Pantoea sp. B65]|uniref:hypothetical protein n=1 Tax=Pantoea sp. B65 TaxID=2813359 RepID=UPI0039B4D20C
MSITNQFSGRALVPPSMPTPATASQPRGLISLLKAVVNLPVSLFSSAPQLNYRHAFVQARQRWPIPQQSVAEFIAAVRQRLQSPAARAIMAPPPEAFGDLNRWMPLIPQPLLNQQQLQRLFFLALQQDNPANGDDGQLVWFERHLPALHHVLTDEIFRAATHCQQDMTASLVPQLLRLQLFSDALQRIHPLLPTVIWAAQLLWQIDRHGLMQAVDGELRIQLHQWLALADGGHPFAALVRHPLSDLQLYQMINRWLDQRLPLLHGSDANRPVMDAASSHTAPATAYPPAPACGLPDSTPPAVMQANGWLANSMLNMPPASSSELLIGLQRCHELLKQEHLPVNLAVGCAPRAENQSLSLPEQDAVMQLTRALVLNQGTLWSQLRIESAQDRLLLQGVAIAQQSRPLPLTPLAGPEDMLIILPSAQPETQSTGAVIASLITWTEQQLSLPAIANRLVAVRAIGDAVVSAPAADNLVTPLPPHPFNAWLQHHYLPADDKPAASIWQGSAWPLAGAAAQSPVTPRVVKSNPGRATLPFQPDEFYESLLLKYRAELIRYPLVTVTQIDINNNIMDRSLSLPQALEMIYQAEAAVPPLTLNYHPQWSPDLRGEMENYILGHTLPDINSSRAMDWDSPQNQYAAWLTGVGAGKRSLDNMVEMLQKIQAPVWDIRRWLAGKITQMVEECGGDSSKITAATPVGVGVRRSSIPGRQNYPLRQPDSWHKIGDFTLQDIVTRLYLRKGYRYESLEFRFPPAIAPQLKARLLQADIQSSYMDELQETLARSEVKEGMLSLYRSLFDRAMETFYESNKASVHIDNHQIRAAVATGRIYQLNWQGEKLNSLLFIPADSENKYKGVIISLWDKKSFVVNINPKIAISFYQQGQASECLQLMLKNMSVKGRMLSTINT